MKKRYTFSELKSAPVGVYRFYDKVSEHPGYNDEVMVVTRNEPPTRWFVSSLYPKYHDYSGRPFEFMLADMKSNEAYPVIAAKAGISSSVGRHQRRRVLI